MKRLLINGLSYFVVLSVSTAYARTVCTLAMDAVSGAVLVREGDCDTRVTPASTFKIPLAVMGYDTVILTDERTPNWPYRAGYPAWGGAAWMRDADPTHWMTFSVVWYSQQITQRLGIDRLRRYSFDFGLGNADVSGDPGKNNALERSWISSSLQISPSEQVIFLRKLVMRQLPASAASMDKASMLVQATSLPNDWTVYGKTGAAFPRKADGNFDRDRGWGWFVGWATNGMRTVVFTRLDQDVGRTSTSASLRARDAFIKQFPDLISASGR
jgi:beta-lactamase class D